MLTNIECWISNSCNTEKRRPPQKLNVNSENNHLLKSGSLMDCHLFLENKLDDEFFKFFLKKANKEENSTVLIELHISWVDSKAISNKKIVPYTEIKKFMNGTQAKKTNKDKFNLYEND